MEPCPFFLFLGLARPQLIGTDARLPYRIEGDSLIIGDGKTWHRLWQRLR